MQQSTVKIMNTKHLSQLHHCQSLGVVAPHVDSSEWIAHIHDVVVISTHEK